MAQDGPRRVRERFRDGERRPSAGLAPGYAQANLVSLPQEYAYDFLLFAQRNPKPCPVLEVLDAGAVASELAEGSDVRTDLPGYVVWENGERVAEVGEVTSYWRADLVTFLIGCSFTFETALRDHGVPVRHVDQGSNVPMFLTNQACRPAGRLSGNLVVSMRPIPAGLVAKAVRVTGMYPAVHGAPVHVGDPAALGVADVATPDFGDAVRFEPGDVPVFWACGVTPQAALMASKLPFAITHAPGHMFVTDVPDHAYAL
ncbi:putative hydro-lyase [Goodfellowiella coeruleoviolacea]|uniref:Putative hydro-lyase LX83_004701 n=1 Tax=Goodfellowiella coeruleoviolacea TaxID=334858 RepID=A0AAE3KMN8_9PSEU|nr:putative hydro-lyase [Goodfellowiella coeruleoviolacea]MCP2167828.1 Uncharacterized protein YcsI, UPF0317 family [Goodfellowiella coeruleoviolacea]